jgi:hypothetical protein
MPMKRTRYAHEKRDLERFAKNIAAWARDGKRWAARGDREMAETHERDVLALRAIHTAVRRGDYQETTMTNANGTPDLDIGDDLVITKTTRRAAGSGTWVCGRLHGHRFDALVFPEHADNPDWEIGESRISKLWVQRLADKKTVFNWDRGADVPAEDATVQAIVDFLCAGLAEHTYGE